MKKALSLHAQIKRLEERGIIVQDEEKAKEILFDIGYYRLGFYTFPFEKTYPRLSNRTHEFREGTLFESIVQLYYFDYDLRKLLLSALTRIEVNIRTRITYMGSMYYNEDPFGSLVHWLSMTTIFNPLPTKFIKRLRILLL